MVYKGIVSTLSNDGKTVMVTPHTGGIVTFPLVVPFFLVGALPIGTAVVYTVFEDNTGIVLSRADGGWNNSLQPIAEEE